jgi:hypothetical protein
MVDIFDFIDKGMEINTNELENLEAKAILLKIFENLDIRQTQPGFYQLNKSIKKYNLRFYRLMRNIYKERYTQILEYLEKYYKIKEIKEMDKVPQESSEQVLRKEKLQNQQGKINSMFDGRLLLS